MPGPMRQLFRLILSLETGPSLNRQQKRHVAATCRYVANLFSASYSEGSTLRNVFCDSVPALGAAQKERSPHFPCLRLCRRLASLVIGVGVRIVLRYVRSEVNWGDGPSRGMKFAGVAPETAAAHGATPTPSRPALIAGRDRGDSSSSLCSDASSSSG